MAPKVLRGDTATLTLDLGARTGWALNKGNGIIESGYVDLSDPKDPQPAWRFINLNRFLTDLQASLGSRELEWIFYEAPHMRGWPATFSLIGLAATVESWAIRHGARRPKRVHSGTIKKHITGNGKAEKEEVTRAVRARWPKKLIEDDNEADALALMAFVIDEGQNEP